MLLALLWLMQPYHSSTGVAAWQQGYMPQDGTASVSRCRAGGEWGVPFHCTPLVIHTTCTPPVSVHMHQWAVWRVQWPRAVNWPGGCLTDTFDLEAVS